MKRLCVYFFYDEDGIVDDYVPYMLENLKPFCSELCIVVNGDVTPESKAKLEKYADKFIQRKNEGMDAWAYKEAIDSYGYEKLEEYDELLLTNFTFFGPIYPLNDMFDTMDKKECDFWGHYRWPIDHKMVVYHHIPSSFFAYRNSILKSDAFKLYWKTLPFTFNYYLSCVMHEQRQTPYYEELGFKGEVYIDNEDYKDYWDDCWPLRCADKLVIDKKYPFVKRRNFFVKKNVIGQRIKKECNTNLIKYIKENTNYDIKLISDNMLRTQKIKHFNRYFEYSKYWLLSKLGLKHYKEQFDRKFSYIIKNRKQYEEMFK